MLLNTTKNYDKNFTNGALNRIWHCNAHYVFCIQFNRQCGFRIYTFHGFVMCAYCNFSPYLILIFAKGDVTQRIYINNGLVSAVSCEGRTRSAQICAIKKVKDFGDYYAMTLPVICSIVSVYFICEKDLLTNGTIEQFEELFDGKIVRMQSN